MSLFPKFTTVRKKYWETLNRREQLGMGAIIFLMISVFFWDTLWLPSQAYIASAMLNYNVSKKAKLWLAQNPTYFDAPQTLETKSLSKILVETAQASTITINSITVAKERVEVHASHANYASAMNWLQVLENKFQLTIVDLEITKAADGIVDLKLTLSNKASVN